MEVKVYKQKVKHLLYEQENHLAELKAENMVSYIIDYLPKQQILTRDEPIDQLESCA